jgi:hypothetical protein
MGAANHSSSRRASTLLATLATIVLFSGIVGIYLQTLIPKYRSAHQGASWRDALHAAEAGANHAIHELNEFAASGNNTSSYRWADKGWGLLDAVFSLNGERILGAALLPPLGGNNNQAVEKLSIDVYTREPVAPYHPWFRIRARGRASLPDRFVSADRRDGRLRRMKLGATDNGKSAPYVSRTVEVIVKPRHRFVRAITTVADMRLGYNDDWVVDSFDSSDPSRSQPGSAAGGVYPQDPAKRKSNGNIASALTRPEGEPFGKLIHGNGAHVAGEVQTVGGDDPQTRDRENVSGTSGMDESRIRDDFDDDIPAAQVPQWKLALPPPLGKTNFVAGAVGAPLRYVVPGNLGEFRVLPPVGGSKGAVEILVEGNLDVGALGSPRIIIPAGVTAAIFVKGDIRFGNATVNSGHESSRVASSLTVFGISESPLASYSASAGAEQTLAFYGPSYAVRMDGTVVTTGSMVAKSFQITNEGRGGFHYDEALGRSGDVTGWTVVSYFEDVRGE